MRLDANLMKIGLDGEIRVTDGAVTPDSADQNPYSLGQEKNTLSEFALKRQTTNTYAVNCRQIETTLFK